MIVIVDYQTGNLKSLANALKAKGISVTITQDLNLIRNASLAILPGVGAFGKAMAALQQEKIVTALRWRFENGKPILGICLGMQLLFESSEENATPQIPIKGLGFMSGNIVKIQTSNPAFKVPHMGWNQLQMFAHNGLCEKEKALFQSFEGAFVYFVHSYALASPHCENTLFVTDYAQPLPAMVYSPARPHLGLGALLGFQFHPEKSGPLGQNLLKTAIDLLCCS